MPQVRTSATAELFANGRHIGQARNLTYNDVAQAVRAGRERRLASHSASGEITVLPRDAGRLRVLLGALLAMLRRQHGYCPVAEGRPCRCARCVARRRHRHAHRSR